MHLQRRTRNKDGRKYEYWELVESYRTQRGPRRRSVAYLGVAGPGKRLALKLAAEDQAGNTQRSLFDEVEPEWVEVDTKRARVERTGGFGGAWLGLEVKQCPSADDEETFILCRSAKRREKENAMHERFERRIEDGLTKMEQMCTKKRYKPTMIAQRLGSPESSSGRAAGLFNVDVKTDERGAAKLVWSKVDALAPIYRGA